MERKRKYIRLKSYDYSSNGTYFVTFCTHKRQCLLSSIIETNHNPVVALHPIGRICDNVISEIGLLYPTFTISSYVIMPNHIHLLVEIHQVNGSSDQQSLPDFMAALKREISRRAHMQLDEKSIWQRSFYDHVVRDEKDLTSIMQYIEENPKKWTLDRFYNS